MLPRILPLVYRPDSGLNFLRRASHNDLAALADILMNDKGTRRYAEQLSKEPEFMANKANLTKCWKLIASEFQRFGADSIASLLRGGRGTTYRDILTAVASRMKVPCKPREAYSRVEQRLVMKVLEQSLKKMTDAEREAFAKELFKTTKLAQFNLMGATLPAMLAALQVAVQMGGFAAYQVNVIIANAVARQVLGHGLKLATNATLNRSLSLVAGPVGWAVSAAMTVPLLTGPAYRVVIPATFYIGTLRQKLK